MFDVGLELFQLLNVHKSLVDTQNFLDQIVVPDLFFQKHLLDLEQNAAVNHSFYQLLLRNIVDLALCSRDGLVIQDFARSADIEVTKVLAAHQLAYLYVLRFVLLVLLFPLSVLFDEAFGKLLPLIFPLSFFLLVHNYCQLHNSLLDDVEILILEIILAHHFVGQVAFQLEVHCNAFEISKAPLAENRDLF